MNEERKNKTDTAQQIARKWLKVTEFSDELEKDIQCYAIRKSIDMAKIVLDGYIEHLFKSGISYRSIVDAFSFGKEEYENIKDDVIIPFIKCNIENNFFNENLKKNMETQSPFFMVYVEGQGSPKYKHRDLESAEIEAKRLSKILNKKTYILHPLKSFEVKTIVVNYHYQN